MEQRVLPQVGRRMKIDVTSDVVCPFCLIGMQQLLFALERYATLHPSAPIIPDIRFLPYQLNWSLAEQPVDRIESRRKQLGADRADAAQTSLTDKMAAVGLTYAQGGPISSSHLAHRLLSFALLHYPARQPHLAMDLLIAHHIGGCHPSDRRLLASLAVRHGIFRQEEDALRWLEGDELDAEVRRAYLTAHRLGVSGVPFFVFQDRWAASGAGGVDGLVDLLEDIVKRETDGSTTPSPTSTVGSHTAVAPKHQIHVEQPLAYVEYM